MSDYVDLTERATAGGWTLPEGWSVRADRVPDEFHSDPHTEYGTDSAYGQVQQDAWLAGRWWWEIVSVWVQDASGREWGRDNMGGIEAGMFPQDDGSTLDLDPLEDEPANYSVIREHDMIGEALRDAVKALEEFGTPVLTEPEGTTVSGL